MNIADQPGVELDSADVPMLTRLAVPESVSHVAVLYEAAAGTAAHPWDAVRVRDQVAVLMTDARLTLDYFPVHFSGSDAAAGITAAFARIAAAPAGLMPDLVLVVGGPAVAADIAVIHRVLAPCIQASRVPVFTALGADDAETILGDTACRVFPGVHAMLEAVAAITRAGRAPVAQLLQEIGSLAGFLLSQHEAESRILMQALLVPALQHQTDRQTEQLQQRRTAVQAATQQVRLRLVREEAMLEQVRARIGIELARLAQQPAVAALNAAGLARMQRLRIGMLLGLLCLIVILWFATTPATTVFFSGCALVVGSAIYVSLSNRIIDGNTASAMRGSGGLPADPAVPAPDHPPPLREPVFHAAAGAAALPVVASTDSLGRREPGAAAENFEHKEFPHE